MIRPQPHIAAMAPYALARLDRGSGIPLVSLSQNESIRPPSPDVAQAVAAAVGGAQLYPDPEWRELRAALSAVHDIAPEGLLCSNGSMELIRALAEGFAGPAAAVLAPAHAYPFFRSVAQMANARFDAAPEDGVTASVDALLDRVRDDTGVVFLANPGNPTGTRIPKVELTRLREGLRSDILLVVDEAYGEFSDHLGERCFDMTGDGATIVLRTFSKAYGMAGFRVGWGVFPDGIAAELRKVMNPNCVTHVSQAAAIAAVQDQAYMHETCALTARFRDLALQDLLAAGQVVLPSHTNFLLLDMGDAETAIAADAALRSRGVLLRRQAGAGLPHMLRMTIAMPDAMERCISALRCWREEETA